MQASNQQLASIAGMLMSISPALHMAPLYIETLYHATSTDGGIGWDNITENLSVAKAYLQYWAEHLRLNNGKTWLKRDNTLHVCGDAPGGLRSLHAKWRNVLAHGDVFH